MTEIVSSSFWTAKVIKRVHFAFAAFAILLVLRFAWDEDLAWLGGLFILVPFLLLTFVRWPYGALFVLIGCSAMPVFFVEISKWKARPEHFATVIVLLSVSVAFLASKNRSHFDKLDYWVLVFIAINFVSSTVGSSKPSSTQRWALQNSLAVIPYFLVRYLMPNLDILRKAFRILLAVGVAESLYGIFCTLSHYAFRTDFGMSVGQYLVDVAAPYGSMYEPNLFGAYAACCAIFFLVRLLSGEDRLVSAIGLAITALGTVLSYSRAALLALVVVSIWAFWKTRHIRAVGQKSLLAPALIFGLVCALAIAAAGGVLKERFTDLYYGGLRDETALVRLLVLQDAWQEIPAHLFLGSGTASFNLTFDWNNYIPEFASEKTWIGNTPTRILHDTGLIGLTIFAGFFISVWRRARPLLKRAGGPDTMLLGLIGGVLLYSVSFQFTDGTILAFFWVHLGFLAAAAILGRESLDGIKPYTKESLGDAAQQGS